MSNAPLSLRLKRDQIFGLHVCVPEAEWERLRVALLAVMLEFAGEWAGAGRLDEPGCRTVMLFDEEEDVRLALESMKSPVTLAPETERLPLRYPAPFAALLEAGDLNEDGSPITNASAIFGAGDVPTLVAMLADPELQVASSESPVIWAPLQALRVLGALRAEAAIRPVLERLRLVDEKSDDWIGSEVATALAQIGPAAAGPAAAFLADEARGLYSRIEAARVLVELAQAWPEQRAACVAAIELQLAAHLVQEPEFNGLLISALIDLSAPEAAPTIERAFAAGRVDDIIVGDLEDVQIALGLKLRRERPPKPNKMTRMGAELRQALGWPEPAQEPGLVAASDRGDAVPAPYRAPPKVGRNDPCPCGSGRKYKKCCGG